MAATEHGAALAQDDAWEGLLPDATVYIEMALDPEVRRIVLLKGPAVLGDPSLWPSQNASLSLSKTAIKDLISSGVMRQVDVEATARLLNGIAMNAPWLASSDQPDVQLPKTITTYRTMASVP